MIVRCVIDRMDRVTDPMVLARLRHDIHAEGPIDGLIIGGSYLVQAIEEWDDGRIRFYLDALGLPWPSPFPADLFEIVENVVPKGWCVNIEASSLRGFRFKRLSFVEWASDDTFYERLVEQDARAMKVYTERRRT